MRFRVPKFTHHPDQVWIWMAIATPVLVGIALALLVPLIRRLLG